MNLKYVTCSGANEYTDINELFSLHRDFPKIEFGIQVSGYKCSYGSERLKWLRALRRAVVVNNLSLPLALHLNLDWVENFCTGHIVAELEELLSYRTFNCEPLFQRIQLNFKIGREKTPDLIMLENTIRHYPHLRFILSYNESNAELINELYLRQNIRFDCLFDNSFGAGITPDQRPSPAFTDVLQGYAGGLSPENITSELSKIALVLPDNAEFYVDAQGKLEGEDGHLSTDKCRLFVANTLNWAKQNC